MKKHILHLIKNLKRLYIFGIINLVKVYFRLPSINKFPIIYLILLFVSVSLLSSCITNKQVQYFQYNDVNVKNVPVDTVIRKYGIPQYEYRIQSNDVLYIRIYSLTIEEFDFYNTGGSTETNANMGQGMSPIFGDLVDENGLLDLIGLGRVKLGGLTIFEAQEKLKIIASQAGLQEPVVKIRLLNFRFTILGEVKNEGTIISYNNKITIPEAIGLAGGTGELGDRSKIKIIRHFNGASEIFYVNLLDEKFFDLNNIYIYQNDVIIVPPVKQRPFRKYFGENVSLVLSSLSTLLLIVNLIK